MKMRLTTPAATREAWLAAGRLAAGAVLLTVAVSACSPSGGSSVPSTFTPTPLTSSSGSATNPATHTPSPAGGGGSSAATTHASTSNSSTGRSTAQASVSVSVSVSVSSSATRAPSSPAASAPSATPTRSTQASSTPRATVTATVTAHATVTQSPFVPSAAPETGGGGTAGLQDGLLFGIGGGSVLAGLGFLAMRRRLARRFAPGRSLPADPAGQDPVDREPAGR